jgi:hypothetical protein
MDLPAAGQSIRLYAYRAGGNADVELRMASDGAGLTVSVSVTNTSGGSSSLSYVIALDNQEHTVAVTFNGNNYVLIFDGLIVGSASPVIGSLTEIDYVAVTQQPVQAGTNMSVSKIDITDCAVPAVVPGWNTLTESGGWAFTNSDFTATTTS